MADPSVANLIKSGARMYYAAEGEALPDETTVAYGAAWGGNWTRVGLTKAPAAFAIEFEVLRGEVEEYLSPVTVWDTMRTAAMETVLAEFDPEYLALAYQGTTTTTAAGAAQKGFDAHVIDAIDPTRTVYAVGIEGFRYDTAGTQQPVRMFFPRAYFMPNGNLEFSIRTGDYVGIPIRVEALADVESVGELVIIHSVNAPATA